MGLCRGGLDCPAGSRTYFTLAGHGGSRCGGGGGRTFYDANGNLTGVYSYGWSVASYSWDAENRLAGATRNGVTESYVYDVDGNRIKKTGGGVTTRTWFPTYEEENGVAIKYYVFKGMRIAVKRGSSLYYLHGDHLASTSLTTSGSSVHAWRTYRAYGSVRTSSGNLETDRTFTGQKSDGTGLLYMNARYYDPALGTFLSADTLVPDPAAVPDYNRFLYARGNPLKYADPSGHCIDGVSTIVCVSLITGTIGGVANAAGNVTAQVIQNRTQGMSWGESIRHINGKETAIAAGTGFVSGALAPFTGLGGTIAVNAVLGGVQHVATAVVAHNKRLAEVDPVETGLSALVGGAAGAIQGALPKELAAGYEPAGSLYGEMKVLTRFGEATDAYAKAVAPKTATEMQKDLGAAQIASMVANPVGRSRLFLGATVGNLSAPCTSMAECGSTSFSRSVRGGGAGRVY